MTARRRSLKAERLATTSLPTDWKVHPGFICDEISNIVESFCICFRDTGIVAQTHAILTVLFRISVILIPSYPLNYSLDILVWNSGLTKEDKLILKLDVPASCLTVSFSGLLLELLPNLFSYFYSLFFPSILSSNFLTDTFYSSL